MSVLRVEAKLLSVKGSPYSQSAPLRTVRETGESHEHYEERVWRERAHVNDDGYIFIPAMALKLCLDDCARFLSESVSGKGKATYTKHFEAGVMCMDNAVLPVKEKEMGCDRLFVPSDGKKGGATRVWKNFPLVEEWQATAHYYVFDPILIGAPEKIEEYLVHAGKFIGLGRFRPRRGGWYGRFSVEEFIHGQEI